MKTLTLTLVFENETHQRLHNVLVEEYGFAFEILPNMMVGKRYQYHSKPFLSVELCYADNELWSIVRDVSTQHIRDDGFYSEKEWRWLDDAPDEVEFLRRELHILFHVRPNFLITPPPA